MRVVVNLQFVLLLIGVFLLIIESKTLDPYKVLEVDKNASQRDIQKAFHKQSLKYHPDKNKNKGAQQKFEQINNAYEILSDEEKRKNYDTYGDEKGNPGFNPGNHGDQGGNSYFTSGGPGQGGWQNMGGSGGSKSFSFSFGGNPGGDSSGFGFNDLFSNLFGGDMKGGGQFGGSQFGGSQFGGSTRSQSRPKTSSVSFQPITSQVYNKEIADQGITWLLLSYIPGFERTDYYESIISQVAGSLQGAIKIGNINCKTEQSFCKDNGLYPRRAPRLFIYSYKANKNGALVEYTDEMAVKNLKTFCQDHLPRFSQRVDSSRFDITSNTRDGLPTVMLLSSKKDTPVIWRALSGLYRKRFTFYDAEVQDVSEVKQFGVDSLPAIVGWLSNGEKHVLQTGVSVKDLKSAVHDLSKVLDKFEKMNKKAASTKGKRSETEQVDKKIPHLTRSNFDDLCGENTPVCIIGAFRSSEGRDMLESILTMVSQKSLSRQQNSASVSYSLLDVTKQAAFVEAFDKSKFKSLDKFLIAYKPRKGKFAAFVRDITAEEVEMFIGSVLNGDVQFSKTRQKPAIK